MNKLFSITPLLLSICLISAGPAAIPVKLVGQWGGACHAVAIRDNYAYIGRGPSLAILDISQPASPIQVGQLNLPDIAKGIVVNANYAYVADDSAGLAVIDISNSSAPVYVGGYDTTGYTYGVAVPGSYAYVADGSAGLAVIDISNPSAPVHVGGYDTTDSAYGVAVSGSYAYVASSWGLEIIDTSNPSAPVLSGRCHTPGSARGVALSGRYAYVADYLSGLAIIDISNPSAFVYLGEHDMIGYGGGIVISGNYACIADSDAGLVVLHVSWQGDLAPPDGDVDMNDLAQFAAHWSEAGCIGPAGCEGADLDNDTHVDFADLLIMAANWLRSPGLPLPPPPRPTR